MNVFGIMKNKRCDALCLVVSFVLLLVMSWRSIASLSLLLG